MNALLKRFIAPLLLLLSVGAFADLIALSYPIILKTLVDGFSKSLNWRTTHGFLYLIILAAAGGAVMSALRDWVSVRLSSRFDNELSGLVMSRVLRIPLAEVKARATGEWLVALQYVQELKSAIGLLGAQALFDLILVFGYAGLLFYYDPSASGLYVVMSLLTLFTMSRLGTTMYKSVDEAYGLKAVAQTYVVESLRSPLLIRVYPMAGWIHRRWRESYERAVALFQKADVLGAFLSSGFDLLRRASPLVVLAWKLSAVSSGKMSFGTALALSSVFAQGFDPFLRISALLSQLQKAILSYRNLKEIDRLQEQGDTARSLDLHKSTPVSVRLKNVCFRYPNKDSKAFLNDLSLEIEPGEKIALVGASGSGKTSLLQLLIRLYPLQSGNIFIDGRPIEEIPAHILGSWVGVVSQDTELFSGTILENIALGDSIPNLARAKECAVHG